MAPAKAESAKFNSHYGINSGGMFCFTKNAVMKECSFLNGRYIPALTAYEYRGYIICAWARPESTNGFTSVGIVFERGQFGSIIQVQRIEAACFKTKSRPSSMDSSCAKTALTNFVQAKRRKTVAMAASVTALEVK